MPFLGGLASLRETLFSLVVREAVLRVGRLKGSRKGAKTPGIQPHTFLSFAWLASFANLPFCSSPAGLGISRIRRSTNT